MSEKEKVESIVRNLQPMNLVGRRLDSSSEDRRSANFVKGGRVYILGDFDESIARFVIPDFTELIGEASGQRDVTIPIYINSNGGDATQLQSLLSLIGIAHQVGIKILTFVVGVAYSCGSLLAVCGDTRLMGKGARHMMHLGEIGAGSKTYEQLKRNNKDAKDFFDETVRIYTEHTKLTEKQVRDIVKDDLYWMDAKQCLKLGLCDTIV